MTTRRAFLITAASAVSLPTVLDLLSPTKPQARIMFTDTSRDPHGPANRSLAALERSWVESRFFLDAMMEEGRVPRDRWEKAKLNVIHGNFDIRDPANGDLLQKVANGVRVPPVP